MTNDADFAAGGMHSRVRNYAAGKHWSSKVCCRQTQPAPRQVIDFAAFTLKGTESLSVNTYGERTATESALGPLAQSLGQHARGKTLAALGFFKPLPEPENRCDRGQWLAKGNLRNMWNETV